MPWPKGLPKGLGALHPGCHALPCSCTCRPHGGPVRGGVCKAAATGEASLRGCSSTDTAPLACNLHTGTLPERLGSALAPSAFAASSCMAPPALPTPSFASTVACCCPPFLLQLLPQPLADLPSSPLASTDMAFCCPPLLPQLLPGRRLPAHQPTHRHPVPARRPAGPPHLLHAAACCCTLLLAPGLPTLHRKQPPASPTASRCRCRLTLSQAPRSGCAGGARVFAARGWFRRAHPLLHDVPCL